MPADRGRHRLLGVKLQAAGQRPVGRARTLDGAATERPVRPEVDADRRLADDVPSALEDRAVDGVRWHPDRQPVLDAVECQESVAHPPGERHHRERAPCERPVAAGLEELTTIDHERRQPPAGNEVDDSRDAGRRQLESLGPGAVLGQADRQPPATGRSGRRERGALGHQFVHRRGRPKDLLIEPDQDPADRRSETGSLLLRHPPSLVARQPAPSVVEPLSSR